MADRTPEEAVNAKAKKLGIDADGGACMEAPPKTCAASGALRVAVSAADTAGSRLLWLPCSIDPHGRKSLIGAIVRRLQ